MKENDESIYGVSVILSADKILNFCGTTKEIAEKLKFLRNSIFDMEPDMHEYDEEENFLKLPVILTEQDDVSGVYSFYLRDFEENIKRRKDNE